MSKDILIETIAEVIHEAWIYWSKTLAYEEALSLKQLERWKKLWVPYHELRDRDKDADREWARKIVRTLENKGIKFNLDTFEYIF